MPNNRRVHIDPLTHSRDAEQERVRQSMLVDRVGDGPFLIQGYSVTSLPPAANWAASTGTDPHTSLIFIPDESGGATLAFSDGTNWLRTSDNAIVT